MTVAAGASFFDSLKPASGGLAPPSSGAQAITRRFPVRDIARLRDAFRQLAVGLMAIHAAGKLHRDVKPPNVIVTRSGRVVLLDFGVASDLADRSGHGVESSMAGTPAYMAPEQATLARATPASDWYAVGVVLYEALATRLPFEGSAPAILFGKAQRTPPPPSAHVEGVPEDLELLAMDLLNADPERRPGGDEILARLEGARTSVRAWARPRSHRASFTSCRQTRTRSCSRVVATNVRRCPSRPSIPWSTSFGTGSRSSPTARRAGFSRPI